MKLTIRERLLMHQILPAKGNRIMMRALNEIEEKIDFNAEELEEYEIKQYKDGSISFSDSTVEFDIDLKDAELKIIKDHYLKLDEENKLNKDTYNLGERVVEIIGE